MDLTFTRTRHNTLQGCGPDGTTLFAIDQSSSRSSETVSVKSYLPGTSDPGAIEAPEGCTKWSAETNTLAMRAAAKGLEQWASKVLGVALTVNIVDNT